MIRPIDFIIRLCANVMTSLSAEETADDRTSYAAYRGSPRSKK
jgi:hypothetical protein